MKRLAVFTLCAGIALASAGCSKKQDASLSTPGFDTLATSEELAQLPQASLPNQQAAVEVLPIEAAPVTQAAPMDTLSAPLATAAASIEGLSYQQKIQTALKNAGLYNGAIDGKIGPASRRAIETFQKNNGLTVDGKVGPKTWAALEPYLTAPAAPAAPVSE
jgi:peptidoglycan hydrolase-like protein with peptidoglycan-binding domain